MNINAVFVLTTIHTAIKLFSGIVINKVLAVYLGPAGLAIVGQLQNFISIIINVASGSIHTGVVKYTAEYTLDRDRQRKVWANGVLLTIALTIPAVIVISVFAEDFSQWILFSSDYSNLILILSVSFVFQVLYMFILSILNGLQDIKLYILANIVISIITTLITVSLSIVFGLEGALYSLLFCQLVVFFFVAAIVYSKYGLTFFSVGLSRKEVDSQLIKQLLQFGAVSFVSGIVLSLTQILVRYIIVGHSGLEAAGYWEALMKISTYFTMLFLLPASIYYLPKYAELISQTDIKRMLVKSFLFFVPIALAGAAIFWTFKDFFIQFLLSEEFLTISPVIALMLIGDIFRIVAYLIVNLMFAKKFLMKLIGMDLMYGVVFVALVNNFYAGSGLMSLGYIYLFCNVLIFLYTLNFYLKMPALLEMKNVKNQVG